MTLIERLTALIVAIKTAIGGLDARVTALETGGGGSGIGGVLSVALPAGRGVVEWTETVTALGVTPSHRIILSLAPTNDESENEPTMLSVASLTGTPLTDQIQVDASFTELTSGPISLNWSAS